MSPLTQEEEENFCALMEDINNAAATEWTEWEQQFIKDMNERYEKYGAKIFLSPKQWNVLRRLQDKAS